MHMATQACPQPQATPVLPLLHTNCRPAAHVACAQQTLLPSRPCSAGSDSPFLMPDVHVVAAAAGGSPPSSLRALDAELQRMRCANSALIEQLVLAKQEAVLLRHQLAEARGAAATASVAAASAAASKPPPQQQAGQGGGGSCGGPVAADEQRKALHGPPYIMLRTGGGYSPRKVGVGSVPALHPHCIRPAPTPAPALIPVALLLPSLPFCLQHAPEEQAPPPPAPPASSSSQQALREGLQLLSNFREAHRLQQVDWACWEALLRRLCKCFKRQHAARLGVVQAKHVAQQAALKDRHAATVQVCVCAGTGRRAGEPRRGARPRSCWVQVMVLTQKHMP